MLNRIFPFNFRKGTPMKVLEDLSFVRNESEDEYRRQGKDHLTIDELSEFRSDPYLYHRKQLGLAPQKIRPASLLDRATRTLVLEGRSRYEAQFAFGGPINPQTGHPYGRFTPNFEDWAAVQGKPALPKEDAALVEMLHDSVRAHQRAGELLATGVAKGVVRTTYRGLACQGRMDWINPERGLVLFGTCDRLSWLDCLARTSGDLHRLAFYRALIRQVTGQNVPAHILAVEIQEPFRTGVFAITSGVLNAAQQENEQALDRLARCRAEDSWPTGYESVRTIDYF